MDNYTGSCLRSIKTPRINSKQIKDQDVKAYTVKLLKENIDICDLPLGKAFFNMTPRNK